MSPAAKGRRGEQEVARLLYKAWFGKDSPADRQVFIRVGFGRKQPTGDLLTPPDFPFIVEIKNTKVELQQLLGLLDKWLQPYQHRDKKVAVVFKVKRAWWAAFEVDAPLESGFYILLGGKFFKVCSLQEWLQGLTILRTTSVAEG